MQQIKTDYTKAELAPVDRALCDYAIKLTRDPTSVTREDIEELRSLGLSDRAISDAVQVISFFNYINRVADGLCVDLEQGMAPSDGRGPK